MHSYLNSSVESISVDLLEMTPDKVGKFDIVLCMSLISWTTYPLWAIKRLGSITENKLVLYLALQSEDDKKPSIRMYREPDMRDYDQRWLLNRSAIEYVLKDQGFDQIRIVEDNVDHRQLKSVELKKPILLHSDYNLSNSIEKIPEGDNITIRTRSNRKACIEWHKLNKIGWVSEKKLKTKNIRNDPLVRKAHQHYNENGIKSLINSGINFMKPGNWGPQQSSYKIYAQK